MSSKIIEVEDGTFVDEVIKEEKPVLVDFWAPWCGPCKAIGPIVEELSEKFGDQIKFVKLNVDDNPSTPGDYNIKAIPTLILFRNAKLIERVTGMTSKSKLEEIITKVLGGSDDN